MKKEIKTLSVILFLLLNSALYSQSVLTLQTGTSMGVTLGADLCANIFNIQGILYGNGTICWGVVGIEPEPGQNQLPQVYELKQNYPNPFNPVTTVKYQLPKESYVLIKLYDITGRETELYKGIQPAGYYQLNLDGSDLSSGIYFLKLEAGVYTKVIKMSLIK
jgi:hypothetical protein